MEKYSSFRDPGTGIQPFLPPVPPQGNESLATALKPVFVLVGSIRTLLVLAVGLIHFVLVDLALKLLLPFAPLYRFLSRILVAISCRLILLLCGFVWFPVEVVKRKRRVASDEKWAPKAGDVVVSNWISWIEVAWLAWRIDPCFALPVFITDKAPDATDNSRSPTSKKSTRYVSQPQQNQQTSIGKAEFIGFVEVSLFQMLRSCGGIPMYDKTLSTFSFDAMRRQAQRRGKALVVFPECTTSNARGLLRFANIFGDLALPVKDFSVFVMCVRCDPPTALAPSLSLSVKQGMDPLSHIFAVSSRIAPHTLTIRLLAPSDSPSSELFKPSEFVSSASGAVSLSEVCASLIADIGRLKRTGMGWEDKAALLALMKQKR